MICDFMILQRGKSSLQRGDRTGDPLPTPELQTWWTWNFPRRGREPLSHDDHRRLKNRLMLNKIDRWTYWHSSDPFGNQIWFRNIWNEEQIEEHIKTKEPLADEYTYAFFSLKFFGSLYSYTLWESRMNTTPKNPVPIWKLFILKVFLLCTIMTPGSEYNSESMCQIFKKKSTFFSEGDGISTF